MSQNEHALWFRQKFEGQFSARSLMKEEVKHFFADLAELIPAKIAVELPLEFFDLEASAQRYAKAKNIKIDAAKEQIIERAEILLRLHGIPVSNMSANEDLDDGTEARPATKRKKVKQERSKVMLTDRTLYDAVLGVRESTGKNPGPNSGRVGLPEHSLGWSRIMQTMRERGETLVPFMQRMEKVVYAERCVEDGKLPTIKASMIFEVCANDLQQKRVLPESIGGYSAPIINACFRHGKVEGLSQFVSAASGSPKDLEGFAVAAGLARKEGNRLIYPSPRQNL